MQYNKNYFFIEILSFVIFFHFFFLGVIFVCDTRKFHKEKFIIDTHTLQSTVVFMPLHKNFYQEKTVKKSDEKKDYQKKIMSYHEYEKKVAIAQKEKKQLDQSLVQPIQNKNMQKNKVIETSTVKKTEFAQKAATTIKKESNQIPVGNLKKNEKRLNEKAKKEEIKKPATKNLAVTAKIDSKKIVEVKKEEILQKNNESELKADELKKDVKKPEEVVEVTSKQIVEKEVLSSLQNVSGIDQEMDSIDLENVSFVGTVDLEMINIKEQIQNEIAQYYKPPIGISKKIVCQLVVIVGSDGKARQVTVKKGSGSIAHDLCARAALLKVKYPKEVIGKEIIVELGQS